ncbi:hypothetical protein Mapa_003995 [Marchantia paleacea]|nr:hypothetical protein Mapa_003995 [Marchantia paleacea]
MSGFTFGIIVEVCLQNVLHIGWIACENLTTPSSEGSFYTNSMTWILFDIIRDPIQKSTLIGHEFELTADDGIYLGPSVVSI